MGMSASQVRFLSLQSRKHDIGRRLTDLSNKKMSLSRDMNKVSRNYTEALNQKMLKWSNNSGASYLDLSYGLLMKPNDYNTSIPYIVSTRDGKVVVDDKNDIMAGVVAKYHDEHGDALAKSFSSNPYVPAELQGKDITYENIARWITTAGGGTITTTEDGLVMGSGTEVKMVTLGDGSVKKSSAYVIPDGPSSYKFTDTLRMQIFQEMGILSPQTMDKYNALLKELYGCEAAQEFGDYGQLLKNFDLDKQATINGMNYHDIFGTLSVNPDNGNFDIDESGGCAMGNLALAQAYLKEYKAFLRTPLTHDIMSDTTYDIAHISQEITNDNWDMLDEKTANRTFNFNYSDTTGKGISNRMIEMFHIAESDDLDVSSSNDVTFTSKGILNNLGFSLYTNSDGAVTSFSSFLELITTNKDSNSQTYFGYGSMSHQQELRVDYDNIGNYDHELNNSEIDGITTWSKLFDYDETWGTGADLFASPDNDGDGYYMGADYLDSDKNTQSGLQLMGYKQFDHTDWEEKHPNAESVTGFKRFVDLLADSFKTIENIDEDAVEFAKNKVLSLYHVTDAEFAGHYKDLNLRKNGDGSTDISDAERRATKSAKDIFGFAWCNHRGSNQDPVTFNTTNVIAAFITFYQMYAETEGNTGLIQNGSDRFVLTGDAADATYNYDVSVARYVASGRVDDAMQKSLDNWREARKDKVEGTNVPPLNGQGSNRESYTKNGVTYFADITRDSNNNITKIVYSIQMDGKSAKTSEISVSGETIKETLYTPNSTISEDNDEVLTGGEKTFAVIEYNKTGSNRNSVTLTNGTPTQTDDVIIYMDSNKVSSIKKYNGNEYKLNDKQSSIPSELEQYIKKSKLYYIASPNDKAIPDANYKYMIDEDSVAESVFASQITLYPEDKYSKKLQALVDKCQARVDELLKRIDEFFAGAEGKMMEYFDAIFQRISDEGWVADSKVSNGQYLNNKLQNNDYFLTVCQNKGDNYGFNYTNKMAHMVTKVFEVNDDNAVNVALSKYEADKTLIQMKERKVDAMMVKLETEQEAVNTELQSIEKVRDQNIEKTFKIFA